MGFGILLLGYALAFAFSLSSVYFFADVLGGLLMAYACSRLFSYHRSFKYPLGFAGLYSVLAISGAVSKFVAGISEGVFTRLLGALYAGTVILLHFSLFFAIISIAGDLHLSKITMKARRNLIFMIAYYTVQTLAQLFKFLLIAKAPEFTNYLFSFLLLADLVLVFLNIVLIGSCLKWIGDENETAFDPNPSGIKKIYKTWSDTEDRIFTPKERKKDRDGKNKKG